MSDSAVPSTIQPPPAPAPVPRTQQPSFVRNPDRIADSMAEVTAAIDAMRRGEVPQVEGNLRLDDGSTKHVSAASSDPAPPPAATPVPPEPEPEPEPIVEEEEAVAADPVAPPVSPPTAQPVTEPPPATSEPPSPVESPPAAKEEELPPLPEGIPFTRLSDADARVSELIDQAQQNAAALEFENAEALLAEAKQIQAAKPIIAKHQERENRAWREADVTVAGLYPDSAKPGSAFATRLEELYGQWIATDDPRARGPQGIIRAASAVAAEQGVNPVSKAAKPNATAAKPAPQPKPLQAPSAPRQSSIHKQPASTLAALQSTSPQSSAPSKPTWAQRLERERGIDAWQDVCKELGIPA